MKKSKFATGKPFAVEVADAMRHHVGTRKVLENNRKNAFEDRDAALAELASLKDKHSPDALKVKERHSDAVCQIEDLSKRIKFHSNQLDDLVENADAPELEFMYDMPDEPAIKEDKDQQQFKGVGRPGKKPAAAPDPGQGTGVDEHLRVSINELDIAENVRGKILKAGYEQVIQVVMLLDQNSVDHRRVLDLNENQYSALKKSIEAFRAKHTKAIKDEALGEARGDGVVQAPKGTRAGRGAGLKLAE